MRESFARAAACCLLAAAAGSLPVTAAEAGAATAAAASGAAPATTSGVGMAATPGTEGPGVPDGLRSPSPGAPCYLLLSAGRDSLASPALLDAPLAAAAAAGLRVVIRIDDDTLSDPIPTGAAPAGDAGADPGVEWAARIGALARHVGPRAVAWQILEDAPRRSTPHRYAYLLKLAAVAVRSARGGNLVVSPPLVAGDAAWAAGVLAGDAGPYLDVLAARDPEALAAVLDVRDAAHPSAAVWVTDAPADPLALRPSATRAWLESYSRGAEVVLFAAPAPEAAAGLASHLAWLRSLLPPGIAPASPAALPLDIRGRDATGQAPLRTMVFYDAAARLGMAAYRLAEGGAAAGPVPAGPAAPPAPAMPVAPGAASLSFHAPLESIDILDPAAMTDVRLGGPVAPGSTATVAARGDYLMLRFRIATAAIPVQESEQVTATGDLSAAEIIALQREFHAAQDARLRHFRADATVAIHYRIANLAQSVDVITENRLYVKDGRQDYEQTALYVDGALWRGKTPPYLPFIQPEKVSEVPLAIVLDEGYRYSLVGRERWNDRDCHVLEFEPATAERSLYRGRVWIDARSFARVRMDAVQEGLKEPLRSNQIDYRFAPVGGPGGDFWLPVEVIGQMVFEVLGYNLVVERRVRFSGFQINDGGFEAALAAAYASSRPLYRETEEGYYRLEVVDGVPRPRDASTLRNAFILGGVSIGSGGDVGSAFAGVNWFDFDFRGTGTQFNFAWAGPFADLSWTQPALTPAGPGRRPLSFTAQASINALGQRDKIARLDDTPREENVNVIRETVRGALAVPMGHHFKWTLEGRATYLDFRARDETADAFILPPSNLERGGLLRLEFNRKGYVADLWAETARRGRWRPWGLPGSPSDPALFDPADRDYARRGLEFRKTFYPGVFHKIGVGLSAFDGHSLDRFSRFELGDFRSARVRGFNGSGIHFDRGLVARGEYNFSLGDLVRVDLVLEHGWIRNPEDFGPATQRVLGAGAGVQFSGPWSTLVLVRTSYGLDSTIEGKGGGGDVRIVMLRTFDRWSRKKPGGDSQQPPGAGAPPPPPASTPPQGSPPPRGPSPP